MAPRAFVAGCAGTTLTSDEAAFFRDADPLGFILFRRNIGSPDEVRALTASLREAVGRADAPILIDQEGGRVQRMGPPHWPRYPAGRTYGTLAAGDLERQRELVRIGARLIAHDLRAVGITVDCHPVLDVPTEGAHDVIGDRAFARDPILVADLGRAAAEGLLDGGVLPVVKHLPGHGRAQADSHESLPRVSASIEELRSHDFVPFRALADMPAGMSAHVVFEAVDPDRPATTSTVVLSAIVRGEIGFGGLLFTDDLSMKALAGSFRARTEAALAAGCDVALHCNGDVAEARGVAEGAPRLTGPSLDRLDAALARIPSIPTEFDLVDARRGFEAALATAA
ncbi:MAG: beta-N-acetylhexosaminidase [Enterovirga sp.]|nr:beta-N-acetylhexosaminidase [Enterovirga sp.]